jgi:hypothetical protein
MYILASIAVAAIAIFFSRPVTSWLMQVTSNLWNVGPSTYLDPALFALVFCSTFAVGNAVFGLAHYSVVSFLVFWAVVALLEYTFGKYRTKG